MLVISNINHGEIQGSFVIAAFAKLGGTCDGEKTLIGSEAVLSRRNTSGCAKCQAHLPVKAFTPLHGISEAGYTDAKVKVKTWPRRPKDNKLGWRDGENEHQPRWKPFFPK